VVVGGGCAVGKCDKCRWLREHEQKSSSAQGKVMGTRGSSDLNRSRATLPRMSSISLTGERWHLC
jgi:hypothetical protein